LPEYKFYLSGVNGIKKCAALIVAAGLSERMGCLKPFLKTNMGKTFLEYQVEGFRTFGIDNVVVVVNKEGESTIVAQYPDLQKEITLIVNPNPENGRFSSIKLGLSATGCSQPVFLSNCDAPYLSDTILYSLQECLVGFDLSIPTYKSKGGHPVLISSAIARRIVDFPLRDFDFKEFLKQFRQNRIEVNEKQILLNINTPEDYKAYLDEENLKRKPG
jgi:CTP:molybdopterin cytidylyltransferase MocA